MEVTVEVHLYRESRTHVFQPSTRVQAGSGAVLTLAASRLLGSTVYWARPCSPCKLVRVETCALRGLRAAASEESSSGGWHGLLAAHQAATAVGNWCAVGTGGRGRHTLLSNG